jgi:protein-S-isoprenylcysteine O-methyltransferase Ste14
MTSYHAGSRWVVLFGVSEVAASDCEASRDNVLCDETQTWLLTFLSWTCLLQWRQKPEVCWIDNVAICSSHEIFVDSWAI